MKPTATLNCLLPLWAAALFVAGCATQDVNPPEPRSNTGYVDFYATYPGALCWDVSRFNSKSQTFQPVFSKLKPPQQGVLRLGFPPGSHRLRITFLNQAIEEPAEIEVEVVDGKVTPIIVTLTEASAVSVQTKELGWGGSVKGPAGRRVKTETGETRMFKVSAITKPSINYKPKAQMPVPAESVIQKNPK